MVEEFKIELATIDDMKAVFDLSNDEQVRVNSFNTEKIKWENHQNWFKNKLNDKNFVFYLVKTFDNNLIAQVRFDISSDEADISISIAPDFRGKGYGSKILKKASNKIIKDSKIKKINAFVKTKNIASQKVFEKAGYILKEENSEKLRYEYYGN